LEVAVFRLTLAGWLLGRRRPGQAARKLTAAGLGPLLAAGGMTLPPVAAAAAGVAAVAAVAASSVAAAPAAKASTPTGNGKALVLLQNGETTAPETTALQAAGWTVTQATPTQWAADSASTFESYAVLVIGDPSTTSSCSTTQLTTTTLGTSWQTAVSLPASPGNVAVLGTAPAAAGTPAANNLITDAVAYAGSGSGTGLYVSLNCGYKTAAAKTAVSLLNGVEGIGAAGGVTVQGNLSCSDPGTLNKWETDAAGTFSGFTNGTLGTSSWPSPGCPVQEAFTSWPALFTPVAYDAASDVSANFTASDGVSGQPYVLLGQPASTTAAATASTETTGGIGADALMVHAAGNPATPGLVHATVGNGADTAGAGVDTENGDFSQSSTDFSIPGFGPALDFTRTYDANLARQEQVAGTPGPMGYGWTDNWASSEIHDRPFPGDIYTVNTPGVTFGEPVDIGSDPAGDVFIPDLIKNNVVEIAAASHAQFGISMTAGDAYVVAGSASGASGDSGDGGAATSALLSFPDSVAVDGAGNLFIADSANGRIQEVSATNGTQFGILMTADHMYTIAGSASGAAGASGDGGKATSALLKGPEVVRTDDQGNVYITDVGNCRVQEVPASNGMQHGVSMTAGDMYTIAGSSAGACSIPGTGDGGPATSARFDDPAGLAIDANGDVYVSDADDDVVREIAGTTGTQWGRPMTANDIYTVAGTSSVVGTGGISGDRGPATSADLDVPQGVALDAAGDLYIADTSNNRIQEVPVASGTQWGQSMTAGDMYTVAGSSAGTAGYSGDGGAAASAEIWDPWGMNIDAYGDLLIPDTFNSVIREVFNSTNQLFSTTPQGTGNTFVLADGSRVDFQAKLSSGACPTGYELYPGSAACTLPANVGVGLQQNPTTHDYVYKLPSVSYTYAPNSGLLSVADRDGNTLTVTAGTPSPGSGNCPSSATSCQTITAASGRSLVIGSNSAGLVTSVTSPAGRRWAYAYNSADQLTSATDPVGNVTSYTYGAGTTGNPQLASDLLTITSPNAQSGGPDAGKKTVNVYDSQGRVTSQTDPMGYASTFSYCANSTASGCLDAATGTGFTRVSVADGNSTVYAYTQGTESARSSFTGTTLTSETDVQPDTTTGLLLDTSSTDGDNNRTSNTIDSLGNTTKTLAPAVTGTATTTTGYAESVFQTEQLPDCAATAQATSACSADSPPAPVTAGGTITPPSSAPPVGTTYTLYDTDQNELYSTTGVYEPGATSAAYLQTTYQLFNGNSVTLPGTSSAISCTATAPSQSLPCAKINADGVVTQLAYDSAGDLASSSTPDGNGTEVATTTYVYDGDGEQLIQVAPDGNVSGASAATTGNNTTVTAYNADGEKTSVTQAGGTGATVTPRTTSYGHDADGNQTTVQDARGYTTTTAYNADDQATLVTNPDGNSTLTCYDGDGNTVETVPAAGVAANSLSASSCPASYPADYGDRLAADATTDTYDANGDKTTETTPAPAGQSGYETTTYTYDPDGNLTETSAPSSSDASGAPGNITADTYDSDGQLSSETTGYGTSTATTTVYCYDANGDKTAVIPGDGDVSPATCGSSSPYETTYAYDSAGELASQTTPATLMDPSGGTTTYTYDPAGNKLTSTDPAGVITSYAYDPAGAQTSVSYSEGSTATAGGTAGPLVSGVVPSSRSLCLDDYHSLTSAGNVIDISTCNGTGAQKWTPNPNGTLEVLGNCLDASGNGTAAGTLAVLEPCSSSTAGEIWHAGAHGSWVNPNSGMCLDDPSSTTTSGTQLQIWWCNGTGAQDWASIQYSYDAGSNKTYMSDATGTSSYAYDPFGELTSAANGSGQASSYSYDANGDTTSITYPLPASATWASTSTVNYAYDHAGLLTGITGFNGNTITISDTADGSPDSVGLGSTGDTITTSYDPAGTPSAITLKNSSSTLQSFTYSDSPAGTILSETDTPTSTQSPADYAYDAQGRVTSDTPGTASAKNYSFDASGNLTTLPTGAVGTYDDAGELTSSVLSGTTTGYTYNADGEQLTSAQGTATESAATWSSAGQLATYDNSAANMTAATYDGNGLRASTTITPTGGSAVTQGYVWKAQPQTPQLLMDGANAYVYATGTAPAEQISLATGTITYLVADLLGSVRGTVSPAGALTATTAYDAWGNPATAGGLTAATPFGYAGYYTDGTGLDYLINRYYNAVTGQFLSVDPLVSKTLQSYAYALGDPVLRTDPTGNCPGGAWQGCFIGKAIWRHEPTTSTENRKDNANHWPYLNMVEADPTKLAYAVVWFAASATPVTFIQENDAFLHKAWGEVTGALGKRSATSTLFSQFACHWWVVLTSQPGRPFHLEVWRPNRGILGDIRDKCNPL
jgi:RHS repeat-associated protein